MAKVQAKKHMNSGLASRVDVIKLPPSTRKIHKINMKGPAPRPQQRSRTIFSPAPKLASNKKTPVPHTNASTTVTPCLVKIPSIGAHILSIHSSKQSKLSDNFNFGINDDFVSSTEAQQSRVPETQYVPTEVLVLDSTHATQQTTKSGFGKRKKSLKMVVQQCLLGLQPKKANI